MKSVFKTMMTLNRPFSAVSTCSGLKTLIFFCVCCIICSTRPALCQTGPELIADMLSAPGVPPGLIGYETYRCRSNSFYTLPDTMSINDYNDFEKAYMQEFHKDERFLHAYDSTGAGIMVKRVLNPNRQFTPQTLPYETLVFHGDTVLFYSATGSLIHRVNIGPVIAEDTIQVDTTPPTPEDLLLLRGFESPQFIKEDQEGRHYQEDRFQIVLNQSLGIIAMTLLNEQDVWMIKSIELFDTLDLNRSAPLFEASLTRDSLYSGKCIFHVLLENYSDYHREDSIYTQQMMHLPDIEMQPVAERIRLWPNPATTIAQLYIPLVEGVETIQVSIYSIDGQLVFDRKLSSGGNHQIPVTGWIPGLYIIRYDAPGVSQIEKLIIK